jgi:hypothetical protein
MTQSARQMTGDGTNSDLNVLERRACNPYLHCRLMSERKRKKKKT